MEKYLDERGEITDILLKEIDSVSLVSFIEGAVRGNHIRKKTIQYDFVLDGELMVSTGSETWIVTKGELVTHKPKHPYAYKALVPSTLLCMSRGGRRGKKYPIDFYPIKKPLF